MLRLKINKEWWSKCPPLKDPREFFKIDGYTLVGDESFNDEEHFTLLFQPKPPKAANIELGDLMTICDAHHLVARHYRMGQVVKFRGEFWKIVGFGDTGLNYTYDLVGCQDGREVRAVGFEWLLDKENKEENWYER